MQPSRTHLIYIILAIILLGTSWAVESPAAGDIATLKGRIIDPAGEPVPGAALYVYNSADVKRPADFISKNTDATGSFSLPLPPGRYWTVAVLRKGGVRFGPLGMDDKHSGEPLVLDLAQDEAKDLDFIVLNLREAALKHSKRNTDIVKISGRILNSEGKPVKAAYAAADQRQQAALPAYISVWTGAQGRYTLYLTRGKFYLGATTQFPPPPGFSLGREIDLQGDQAGLDLIVTEPGSRQEPETPGL